MSKYIAQDFIELTPKEFIYFTVTSEFVVVVKNLEWRSDKKKVVDLEKLCDFVVHKFFI
jgi:hypothetical protein